MNGIAIARLTRNLAAAIVRRREENETAKAWLTKNSIFWSGYALWPAGKVRRITGDEG